MKGSKVSGSSGLAMISVPPRLMPSAWASGETALSEEWTCAVRLGSGAWPGLRAAVVNVDDERGAALATLIAMEVVLGIDNLIFISILTNKLPEHQRSTARRVGISGALVLRLAFLSVVFLIVHLTEPVVTVFDHSFSWRDMILIAGGGFLALLPGDITIKIGLIIALAVSAVPGIRKPLGAVLLLVVCAAATEMVRRAVLREPGALPSDPVAAQPT